MATRWLGEGRATLRNAARLVARLCAELGLPATRLGPDELKADRRGITTHASVTEAFKRSSHVDPGGPGDRRWPWAEFLAMVGEYL
jgi:hypothetical protein